MRKLFILFAVTLVVSATARSGAYAFATKDGQDCTKCHTLSVEQAHDLLKDLIPDIKVLEVGQGPVSGLWEVGIETGNRKSIIYLNYAKDRIVAGNVFDIKTKTNYTQESLQKINKVDVSLIPLKDSVVMGDKDAKYKVFVFDDPE
jgi:thiol:disulfide interchange protein DsbC